VREDKDVNLPDFDYTLTDVRLKFAIEEKFELEIFLTRRNFNQVLSQHNTVTWLSHSSKQISTAHEKNHNSV
jgi:hypothetical protein